MFKNLLRNWLLKNVLILPIQKDVIDIVENGDKVSFTIGGKKLEQQRAIELVNEAKVLQELSINKLLIDRLIKQEGDRINIKAKNWEDVLTGKASLYGIDLYEKLVVYLAKIDIKNIE